MTPDEDTQPSEPVAPVEPATPAPALDEPLFDTPKLDISIREGQHGHEER
jgi:hypothetical protein